MHIVVIKVRSATRISTPSYDIGVDQAALRRQWTAILLADQLPNNHIGPPEHRR